MAIHSLDRPEGEREGDGERERCEGGGGGGAYPSSGARESREEREAELRALITGGRPACCCLVLKPPPFVVAPRNPYSSLSLPCCLSGLSLLPLVGEYPSRSPAGLEEGCTGRSLAERERAMAPLAGGKRPVGTPPLKAELPYTEELPLPGPDADADPAPATETLTFSE
jgi:hypothetical protein